jgi:flagellar biosynthesis regulator FlaF
LYPDSDGNGSEPSSEDVQNFASEDVAREELRAKLYSVGINGLRKLAKKRGLTATGTTAILVNRMIQDGVTIEDLN